MSFSRLLKNCLGIKLAIVILAGKVNSKFCNGGHICSPPKECCPLGCCLVYASSGFRPTDYQTSKTTPSLFNLLFWNHWSFWILLALLLLFCMCACGMWKKRQFFTSRWWHNRNIRNEEECSELDSTGSCYLPPQYSRCSSFHYAPPPYSEVTSKPDLYPLVISYRSDNGKLSDNRLMVQYFRNYIVHPAIGSLSDESTVDSISSTFFGESIQDADSSLPPTYEEFRTDEQNLADVEPPPTRTPLLDPKNHFFRQAKLRNGNSEIFLEHERCAPNNEIQQVVVENIRQSIQKASSNVAAPATKPRSKTALSSTVKCFKTLQNTAQSLPNNLYTDPSASQGKRVRPNNLYLDTFQQNLNKSITISSCDESTNGNSYAAAHQYSSDIILAQPQSYCGFNNELHYHSSDILNRLNHYLHAVNDSYSSEDNLSQARGSLQDFVSSDGLSHSQMSNLEVNNFSTSSDVSSLQGCGSPDSPPRATSPTGEFRNLLDKIQLLPVQKYPTKFTDVDVSELLSSRFENFPVPKPLSAEINVSEWLVNERDLVEKSCLLTEITNPVFRAKPKKHKALEKENFPSRSKTFYIPFCHNSLKRNTKLSTSAPVTPVTNIPSPSTVALSFASNNNKCGSKSMRSKVDSRPLLQDDEDNSEDEVF